MFWSQHINFLTDRINRNFLGTAWFLNILIHSTQRFSLLVTSLIKLCLTSLVKLLVKLRQSCKFLLNLVFWTQLLPSVCLPALCSSSPIGAMDCQNERLGSARPFTAAQKLGSHCVLQAIARSRHSSTLRSLC